MLKNLTVKDYMTTSVTVVSLQTPVADAISKLVTGRITSVPVVDGHGQVVGCFSELGAMKVAVQMSYNQDFGGFVSDYMSNEVNSIGQDTLISELADKLQDSDTRHYLVMDDMDLVGVISRHDVLRAMSSDG